MTLIQFYIYECGYCHTCIHTYIKKNKCIKCGYNWEVKNSFNLTFPNALYEDNDED